MIISPEETAKYLEELAPRLSTRETTTDDEHNVRVIVGIMKMATELVRGME